MAHLAIRKDTDHQEVIRDILKHLPDYYILLDKSHPPQESHAFSFADIIPEGYSERNEYSDSMTRKAEWFPGYFNIHTTLSFGIKTKDGLITHFRTPFLDSSDDKDVFVNFDERAPESDLPPLAPLTIALNQTIRNEDSEVDYKTYFWVDIDPSGGMLGIRSPYMAAIQDNFRRDIEVNGPWDEMESDLAFLAELTKTVQSFEEGKNFDFKRYHDELNAFVLEFFDRNQGEGVFERNDTGRGAVDVSTSRLENKKPKSIERIRLDAEDLFIQTTLQRFGMWSESRDTNIKRITNYWKEQYGTPLWQKFMEQCWQGGKGSWDTVIDLFEEVPFDEDIMNTLLIFITGDVNWPGFTGAYLLLLKRMDTHEKEIRETIVELKDLNKDAADDFWIFEHLLARDRMGF